MSKHGLSRRDMFREIKQLTKDTGKKHELAQEVGLGTIRYVGHLGLAVASTTMERGWFGVDFLRPDTLVAGLSGFGWLWCKIRKHKGLGFKTIKASGAASTHAYITRLVIKARSIVVHGPEGWSFKTG